LAALGLVVAMVVVVAVVVPPDYADVVLDKYSTLSEGSIESAGTGRGLAWEAAVKAIADNPFWGSGLSTRAEQAAIAPYYEGGYVTAWAAHNSYLAIGVSTGILGLAAFIVAFLAALKLLWSKFSRALASGGSQTVMAASCLLTGLVVTLVQALQLDLQMEKYPWLLLGAALAAAHWRTTDDRMNATRES
jgi:O-antigen ligase